MVFLLFFFSFFRIKPTDIIIMSETQGPEEKERLSRKTKITKIYVNVHMGMGTWEKSHSICISLLVNFNETLQFIDRVVAPYYDEYIIIK